MERLAASIPTSSPDFPAVLTALRRTVRGGLCLSVSLGLVVQAPLALAQDLDAADELEALIPDEGVTDAAAWAALGAGEAPVDEATEDARDEAAEADFAALEAELEQQAAAGEGQDAAMLAIDDPSDLSIPPIEQLEADGEAIEFVTFDNVVPPIPAGTEEVLSSELVLVFPTENALFPIRDEFLARFKDLSAVADLDDDGSQAMLAAQARSDEELLDRMLRVYGYFDAQVIRSVSAPEAGESADANRAIARFDVIPGPRYTVGAVDMGQVAQAGADEAALRASYKVNPGDPLSIDAIADGRYLVDIELGERGFPFAAIADPSLLVDHARQEGDVTLPVTPGGRYNFGNVTSNDERFLSSEHLADIAEFASGDLYQRSLELDLRRAIQSTGLVGSVTLTPVEVAPPVGDQPGTVDMAVAITRAPLRTIEGSVGYGSSEGIRLAGAWEHRNLFPPEGMLRVRGVAGTQEQLAGATVRFNNFHGRDRVLTFDAYASNMNNDAFDAEMVSLIGTYEQLSTLLFQRPLSYGVGLELVVTNERDERIKITPPPPRETYLIAALPLHAQWDTSDDLLNPTEGFRVRGAISPEYSRFDETNSTYLKVQFDLSYYQTMSEDVVLAGRARLGSIYGAELVNIAPSRRFYGGGGGSVRGYGYRAIGPRDVLGEPNGGRSLVELSVEARIKTGMFANALSVVPFADFGSVARGSTPDFAALRTGVGVGVRYDTGFGPIRVDVGVPLNRQPGDAPVAVYVGLGQAF
ncbi:MAG: BamA/TamA family outer membrane protein [Pseudomonadota bacterium]